MLKSLLIIIYILAAILIGCSYSPTRNNLNNNPDSISSNNTDIKKDLESVEETDPSLNYNSVIKQFSKILPKDMSITKFQYFVIFSALNEKDTYNIIDNEIRNTTTAVLKNYNSVIPDKVTAVFLFDDFNEYKEFSINNFDIAENDLSPYGFYKTHKNVIVIRYTTWKGSVIHEVTHALLQYDFPDMPSWFNEGIASLNEKSSFKNDELTGQFSWRIISLRNALSNNSYTGLRQLMESNDDELYGKRSSFYYAQARYLLMNLQKKGLLYDYYKSFRDTYAKDNTGISQIEAVWGKNLDEIDNEYLQYIRSFEE